MDNLDELYQEVILDHARNPRNYGELSGADQHVHADNPTCGDELTLHLEYDDAGNLSGLTFTGQGCAISQASASLMTQKIKGLDKEDVLAMVRRFIEMLTAEQEKDLPAGDGDLAVFKGVREYPQRVKCATLGWNALLQALQKGGDITYREDA
jgi:nitrogen fixation NifU-like protein